MVQRKVPSKLGIKTHLNSDTQLVKNLIKPASPQTHEKLNNKIMKKPRPIKRAEEPPFKKKKTHLLPNHEPGSTPNYMKSTSSFDARKEVSAKTLSPSKMLKTNGSGSGHKGSRTSSLKMVRTLTKTPSFKPVRPSKKVILCQDLDAQRATCSSTLKDSKFPKYLQLSPGGSELEGTSAMKVCPYTYCSLNGHHHDPVPPLKCFLSARRRALNLKPYKSFKLGCLSPRQTKPSVKKNEEIIKINEKETPVMEEESKDFFMEIYSKEEGKGEDLECSNINWEEGYCSASCSDDVCQEKIEEAGVKNLYGELQELYDEESVSSGAWSDEDGESESDSLYQQMKINQIKDQDFLNEDAYEEMSTTTKEADVNDKMDEIEGLHLPIGDQNINFQQEETCKESKSVPDFAEKSKDCTDENRTTIINNIIQFNISVFINGEKTEHSEMDKSVTLNVPATSVAADKKETEEVKEAMDKQSRGNGEIIEHSEMGKSVTLKEPATSVADDKMETEEVKEALEEQSRSNEQDEAGEVNQKVVEENQELTFDDQDIASNEQSKASNFIKKQDDFEQECKECETDKKQPHEITPMMGIKKTSFCKKSDTHDDLHEFNPRGPNFLPEVQDPDAETVDLRHQMMDERKNAEEWMVDFALQQAVTTLAPARKKKVALLVEAFEKVMPIPKYETHNRHTSKAFTNARPMQACN